MGMPEGLVAVRDAHRFDEAALDRHLGGVLPDFKGPAAVLQFRGGQSNPTFFLETATARYVLRKKPPGKLLPGAHAVEREYRVMDALAGAGLPVARVLHLCTDETVIGTPFYLMEYLEGRIFRDPRLPELQAAGRAPVYDAMNATLAKLHGIDWRAAGLQDFGKPDNYIARQIALWTRQYQATRTDDVPALERLMEWLPRNIPDDDRTTIVHGDYRLENLLFHPTEPRVIAVLDWELSTLGHPMSDLAFNCMTYYLPADDAIAPGFAGCDLDELGIPSEQAYLTAYASRSGQAGISHWNYYMAFSLFRTAAIQQGVYARAMKGNASSDTARLFGGLYPKVAARGWALVEENYGGARE